MNEKAFKHKAIQTFNVLVKKLHLKNTIKYKSYNTIHEKQFMVYILLYFIKCIC